MKPSLQWTGSQKSFPQLQPGMLNILRDWSGGWNSKRANSFNQDSPALQYLVAPANITIFKSPHAKHWMWHPWPFKNIRNRQTNKSFRKSFTKKISALCKTSPTPSGLAVAGPCETMLERPPLPPHRSDERELWSATQEMELWSNEDLSYTKWLR